MRNDKNMYYAEDGNLIYRKSDDFIMGDAICLGEYDNIDNYEERETSEEDIEAFFESVGVNRNKPNRNGVDDVKTSE